MKPVEIVVLSPEESRIQEERRRLAAEGITSEMGFRLVGLTEGEGHFGIYRQQKGGYYCLFVIKLRADDRRILEDFHTATGVGKIKVEATPSRYNPCVRWEVNRKADCEKIADIFRAYPLRSKKARDFAIWDEAVEWMRHVQYGQDWSQMKEWKEQLRDVRQYVPLEDAA